MAGQRYDHPNVTVRRETIVPLSLTSNATEFRWAPSQKARVRTVSFTVLTAGTGTSAALTIKNGTTSIGALALSTNAAGVAIRTSDLGATAGIITPAASGSATGYLDIISANHADMASMKGTITIEWEVLPDATHS